MRQTLARVKDPKPCRISGSVQPGGAANRSQPFSSGNKSNVIGGWLRSLTNDHLDHYLRYRARLRGFDLDEVEKILRFGEERYLDTVTGRAVVVGKHGGLLVMIPYDMMGSDMVPITIHATTRQQVNFRLKSGRFRYE